MAARGLLRVTPTGDRIGENMHNHRRLPKGSMAVRGLLRVAPVGDRIGENMHNHRRLPKDNSGATVMALRATGSGHK